MLVTDSMLFVIHHVDSRSSDAPHVEQRKCAAAVADAIVADSLGTCGLVCARQPSIALGTCAH
jgi:hypothetical protein